MAVAVCLVVALGSGCTPEAAPAPVPSATTPVETEQEREQRVAYEAAEKSYRAFRTEFRRVTGAGGAARATTLMKATAGGPYLAELTENVQAYKEVGYRTRGAEKIGYVRPGGYSADSLVLNTCEDDRGVRTVNRSGGQVAKGGVLVLELEVKRAGETWKVWSGEGKEAQSCD